MFFFHWIDFWKWFLIICILALDQCHAVDKSKFRTCEQTSFCRRNRNLEQGSSTHELIDGTLNIYGATLTADISNPQSEQHPLTLTISFFENNILRMEIDEKNPLKPRYRARDVLLDIDVALAVRLDSKTKDEKTIVTFGDNSKMILQHKPFKLDVYQGDEHVISTNALGLFNFEHLRKKEEALPSNEQENKQDSGEETENQGDANQEKAEEMKKQEEGLWEESFGTHRDSKPNGPSSIGMDFSFISSKHVYGIPEHASDFALKPTKGEGINSDPYRLYNLDVFEYELDVPMALYGSVPLMISHNSQRTCGVFWLNPSETWIDVYKQEGDDTNTHWISESGIIDVFFLLGPNPDDVFSQYALLTGTTELPPMFSIAYHQCRWNYRDEHDVADVDAGFDEHDIPYDVLWLDIEHTEGKKYFTWDKNHFPTPEEMQKNLATKKRKMVTIIDPHIKRESGYHIHTEAQAKGYYIKNHENKEYEGWCWPGSSSWIDFTSPDIRKWWTEKFDYSSYKGSTEHLYTWNDMNEPSVFNGPEVSMHKDAIHYENVEHRDVHNIYGMYMHMATRDGLVQRNKDKNQRPFVLSRAFFAGSQRFGAIWTGDNAAQWGHLEYSEPMLLSLGISGISFSGADVGGFFGNPDAELMTRWYQAGAFQPFFRGHAHLDTKRREPWLFGDPYTDYIRNAIKARYSLLPFWYTLFYKNYIDGMPPMRPLWVEYPKDSNTFSIQDQHLVGNAILVKPVTKQGQQNTEVYFPEGEWYNFFTGEKKLSGPQKVTEVTPLSTILAYQRGGTIIPKKERGRRSSSLMIRDPYTIVISLDSEKKATGELYIDDGHSFDFKKGSYIRKKFSFSNNQFEVSDLSPPSTTFTTDNTVERIVVRGYPSAPSKVVVESSNAELEFLYDEETQVLTIRKPDLSIAKDWIISIH